jgi:competence protein ComEC
MSESIDRRRLDPPLVAVLRRCWRDDRDRAVLWIPVIFAAGIGGYFALPSEPPSWVGALAVGLLTVLAFGFRQRPSLFAALLVALALCAGFAVAQLRTASIAAPVLQRDLGPVEVIGQVHGIEQRSGDMRIVLQRPRIARLAASETPERLRLVVRKVEGRLLPGAWVKARARLRPPPEPAAPGAYDFARRAYFDRLGAVGFVFGSAAVIAPPEAESGSGQEGLRTAWWLWWNDLRQRVFLRIRAVLPGDSGAVAAAMITGQRGAIPESVLTAMRDSGLAHLLAISGLHLGLMAGTVFLLLRAGLALVPPLALRYPIKKWAAVAALQAAGFYLFLAGATVPTQRAFVMAGIVLLAVLLDRLAITMRLVAWAAVAVLLLAPESLLTASFQLSFAAVTALVAGFEALRDRRERMTPEPRRWYLRPLVYLTGVALSSLIAVLATTPFALFHFNRLVWYGLAANLVAVPVAAIWVMPAALFSLLLMPFGLEAPALWVVDRGLAVIIAVATQVSTWPGAVQLLPAMPLAGLLSVAAGGLWLCLWQGRWRWCGLPLIVVGLLSMQLLRQPDLLISADGDLLAARAPDGALVLSSRTRSRFTAEQWLRRAGQEATSPWPNAGEGGAEWLRCDPLGCIYRRGARTVALVTDPRALAEDCRRAEVIVATVQVPRACGRATTRGPEVVISGYLLWRDGGHALWLDDELVRVKTVREQRGRRPWVRQRGRDAP